MGVSEVVHINRYVSNKLNI